MKNKGGVGRAIGAPVEPMLPTDKLERLIINPMKQIEDTIDLTKQYHNLLQRTEGSNTTAYTWDSNVLHAVGGENNNTYQYLQDELGSPIRLVDENGIEQEIYGYDEFGGALLNNNQISWQPFTYTGYQKDNIANTYYAQAREYKAEVGRFTGEDMIKGRTDIPITLNAYTYCQNMPLIYVDRNGLEIEATEDGKEAHRELQAMLSLLYPDNIEVEKSIPGGSKAGGTGFADIVYRNPDGVVEVYEIKPGAYAAPWTPNNAAGKEQLNRYVQALGSFERNVQAGDSLSTEINMITLPSVRHSDKLIKYYTYSVDPGMIYWNYVNTSQTEKVLANPKAKEKTKEKEKAIDIEEILDVAATVGLYLGGGILIVGGIAYYYYSFGDPSMIQKGVECFQ